MKNIKNDTVEDNADKNEPISISKNDSKLLINFQNDHANSIY
jgi:hypothetical protein